MMRFLKLALQFCAGLFAVLALVYAAIVLLLVSGPVQLDVLARSLAAVLSNPASGVSVSIEHALVTLGRGARLEIVARGVLIRAAAGNSEIALPELSVDLAFGAALRGVIAPTRIVLARPTLRVARDPQGLFHLGFDGAEAASSEQGVRQVLRDLSGPLGPDERLASLTALEVRNAGLVFDDQALGVTWRAHDADLVLRRDASGLRGFLTLPLDGGAKPSRIEGEFGYVQAADRLDARLAVSDVVPAGWALVTPALAPLAAFDLPVSGTVRLTLDPARLAILAASCDLRLGAGALRRAELPGGAVAVSQGSVIAFYDPVGGRIMIERAELGLGGPRVAVSGTVDGVGGGLLAGAWPRTLAVSLQVDASGVPVAALPGLWPAPVASDARRWVLTHVRDGAVDRAAMRLGIGVDLDASDPIDVREFAGTMDYRGLTVEYLDAVPPARGIAGTARFDRAGMSLAPTGAAILGMRVSDARITFSGLDTAAPRAAASFAVAGPVADALAVLDAGPLRNARIPVLETGGIAGTFDARLAFGFPLTEKLRPDQVSVSATATLAGVSLSHAVLGRDLSAGAFKLRLERDNLQLDGTAAVAGVPISLVLQQNLAAGAADRMHATVRTVLDDEARRALGLDIPGVLGGKVGVDLVYAAPAAGAAQAQLSLDLGASALDLAPLDWRKPAGTPAKAALAMTLAGDRVTAIRGASLSGGGLEARLDADFNAEAGFLHLSRIALAGLKVGATDLSGTADRRADGGWRIAVAGSGFDATALLRALDQRRASGEPDPPLELDARLDRVVLGPGREARAVQAQATSDGVHWLAASADATLAGGTPVRLRYGPVAGTQRFDLGSNDFGGLLALLDIADNVRGGRIQLGGTAIDEGPRRRLKLHAEGSDYRLVNATLLARLLSLASFSGIGALLSGEGIPFTRLEADLVADADRIAVDDFRTSGGAIGISAVGTIDRAAGTLDLSGTLVPAYRINSVLGNVPVIGNLLMGGEGEGVFGANFRIAGPLAEPKIAVNPLSALAPGFLRKLFLFAPGNPSPAPAAPPAGDAAR